MFLVEDGANGLLALPACPSQVPKELGVESKPQRPAVTPNQWAPLPSALSV